MRAYKMGLEEVGLFETGNSAKIKASLWIECLRNTDTAECIEANLGLKQGSFRNGRKGERRKGERRKENTELVQQGSRDKIGTA